jgi:hypothetical protein
MELLPIDNRFLQIVDSSFLHSTSMVYNSDPSFFEWSRDINSLDHLFLTHENILRAEYYKSLGFKNVIGIFYESPSILRSVANQIIKNSGNLGLDLLLVSNTEMLNLPKTVWIPGGGIWHFESIMDINSLISRKDNLVSMVCSGKNVTKLHRYRREIFDMLLFDSRIKLFGPPICNPIKSNETLRSYRFSIIVENHLDQHYFTEKILNCFAQGTVPVYLGSPLVNKYFDHQGIITFSKIHDLKNILPSLTEDLYISKIDSIIHNYKIAIKSFTNIENYLIDNKILKLR